MKTTDVPCSCACGWSGTLGDSIREEWDADLSCPNCLLPLMCDDTFSQKPIVLTVNEMTITRDRDAEFLDDGGMIYAAQPWPPWTVSIIGHAHHDFREGYLLQVVGKRIEIRILEETCN